MLLLLLLLHPLQRDDISKGLFHPPLLLIEFVHLGEDGLQRLCVDTDVTDDGVDENLHLPHVDHVHIHLLPALDHLSDGGGGRYHWGRRRGRRG